jgi:hypothetical protein
MWLRGTKLCINCSSWPHFATSFMQLRNDPKCSRTLCNAPKHEFRVQWSGLGAFVVKNPEWLRGTNFWINCTSWPRFAPSFMQLRNDSKCTQTLCSTPKHEFRVQCGGLPAFVVRNPDVTLWHPVFHRVSCSYKTIPNAPKHYATHRNMSLGSNGVDWVSLLREISTSL